MVLDQLKPNVIVRGPIFPEPVQVIVAIPMGAASVKLVGKGLNSNLVHEPILSPEQLAQLEATPEKEPFDGDPVKFRIGVEAFGKSSNNGVKQRIFLRGKRVIYFCCIKNSLLVNCLHGKIAMVELLDNTGCLIRLIKSSS